MRPALLVQPSGNQCDSACASGSGRSDRGLDVCTTQRYLPCVSHSCSPYARAAGVEAHTIVRDQLTTEHEQEAIRKVSRPCEHCVFREAYSASAQERCSRQLSGARQHIDSGVATVSSQPGQTARVPPVQGRQQHGSLQRDAITVDAVVSTVGFPLVGGPAGTMEGGRQADVVSCGSASQHVVLKSAQHGHLLCNEPNSIQCTIVMLLCFAESNPLRHHVCIGQLRRLPQAKAILSAKNVPYVVAAPLLIQVSASLSRLVAS